MFSANEEARIVSFNAIRRLKLLFKFLLELLSEIKSEHDINVTKIKCSLRETEFFLKEKYNIDIQLTQMAKHVDYLDDDKIKLIRKRILDYGNSLVRETESESENF